MIDHHQGVAARSVVSSPALTDATSTTAAVSPGVPWRWLAAVGSIAGWLVGCAAEPPAAPPTPPDFQPSVSVEDLMRSMIDPAADTLWDAVVITSTPEGLREQRPEDDEDWLALERSAMLLAETGNLLQIEGRPIADPGSASEFPGIDSEPGEIAVRVARNREVWLRLARELHDAAALVRRAVIARDVDALLAGGARLDAACESCHSRFWYPDVAPPAP